MKCFAACGLKIDSLGKERSSKALTNSRSHRRAPGTGWSMEHGGVEKTASLLDMGHKRREREPGGGAQPSQGSHPGSRLGTTGITGVTLSCVECETFIKHKCL